MDYNLLGMRRIILIILRKKNSSRFYTCANFTSPLKWPPHSHAFTTFSLPSITTAALRKTPC